MYSSKWMGRENMPEGAACALLGRGPLVIGATTGIICDRCPAHGNQGVGRVGHLRQDVIVNPTGMMMVTVRVRDLGAAVQRYRDVLGLTVAWVEADEFCMLVPPGSTEPALALATDHPERIPAAPGIGWTPTLAVDDFDAALAELRDRGVTFDAEEEGADEGYRLVRVRDPEGNPIGITASR
jgi:catechol 2,3-dioxygenase-like lactoylglutathione lyase family enzyme